MSSESLFSFLLVQYDETDRQHILSVIAKILGKIEISKYRSISRNRLLKKTKHSGVIFNILYIAGFKDNEAKDNETDITTAQNVFRQIPSRFRSKATTNDPKLNNAHHSGIAPLLTVQNDAFEESKSNHSNEPLIIVTSDIQHRSDIQTNKRFTKLCKDLSVYAHAFGAASGNIALAAQLIPEVRDSYAIHASISPSKCCVGKCPSVTNVLNKVHTYQGSLNAYVCMEIVSLLNDWNHLLMNHDNDDDFEYIYNTLTKCDIKHCLISKRHHRDRSTETTAMSRIPLSHDTMDRIHTYLLHSYDSGYRLKSHDKEAITHNKQLQLFGQFPHTLSRYTALTSARKEVIGSHYSFGQQFYYWDYFKKDTHRHHGYERNEWYIPPKYGSLKNELVNNQLAIITKAQWNAQYEKVTKHHKTKYCKQITAQPSGAGRMHDLDSGVKGYGMIGAGICGISEGTQITLQHLMAVSSYCAFSHLCSRFSETYRRLYDANEKEYVNDIVHSMYDVHNTHTCIPLPKPNLDIYHTFGENIHKAMHSEFGSQDRSRENDYNFKKRHSNFHHLAKYLFEAVNIFTRRDKPCYKKCFHGTTSEFVFDSMMCSMHQPFSTTMSSAIANNFGDGEGVILEIQSLPFTRYFECMYLSNYPAEREVLFLENFTPIMIQNITLMKQTKDFRAYIQAIHVLESMISCGMSDLTGTRPNEQNKLLIINLIEMELSRYDKRQKQYRIHAYVMNLFHNICIKRQQLNISWIHLNQMLLSIVSGMCEQDYLFVKGLFCTDQGTMLNLHVLCTLFPNLTTVCFFDIDTITLQSLRYLLNYLVLDRAQKLCKLVISINRKETSSLEALVTEKEMLSLIQKVFLLKWHMQIKHDLGGDTIVLHRIIVEPMKNTMVFVGSEVFDIMVPKIINDMC
eukprot:857235_1